MYTIQILSRPNSFTQSVYREMHKDAIPCNIVWAGYIEFPDLDSVECDFKSHGRKVKFNEKRFIELCNELDTDDNGNFTVAVIERNGESISGYVGELKIIDAAEASRRLISLSHAIDENAVLPDCTLKCLKKICCIDRRIKVVTENRLSLLSFIPGLSLYALNQKGKALVCMGLFLLTVFLTAFSIMYHYPEGDIGCSMFLLIPAFLLTMFECDYVCYGEHATWHSYPGIRGLFMMATFPIAAIIWLFIYPTSLWFILFPISAGLLIYVLMTATNKRKYVPLKDFKIVKSEW